MDDGLHVGHHIVMGNKHDPKRNGHAQRNHHHPTEPPPTAASLTPVTPPRGRRLRVEDLTRGTPWDGVRAVVLGIGERIT